jgi:hypothetical protein
MMALGFCLRKDEKLNMMKEQMYNNQLPLPEFEFDEYNFSTKLYDNVSDKRKENIYQYIEFYEEFYFYDN